MQRPVIRLSLSDLAAAGIRLRSVEVVTIVRELALKVSRGEIPGVPSSHVIRIASDGGLSVGGPVAAGGNPVARAAQLLESLLPGFDAPPELRAPGALRLAIARALGTLDLPQYPSLESFADALARFGAPDPAATLAQLVDAATAMPQEAAAEAPPQESESTELVVLRERQARELTFRQGSSALTISDIRRARRATGMTLAEIADRTRIPTPLLRELEWGYLRNWPAGHYGRTQLVRYARAAGLDDEVVVRTVWPLLEEAVEERQSEGVPESEVVADVLTLPVADGEIVEARPDLPGPVILPTQSTWRPRALAALAIAALLLIALVPGVWQIMRSNPQLSGATSSIGSQAAEDRATPAPGAAASSANEIPRSITSGPSTAPDVNPAATQAEVPHPLPASPQAAAPPIPAPRAIRTPPQDRPDGKAPGPHPAAGLPEDAIAYSPAFATSGSAMFYHAEADGRSSLMRADTDSSGAILKITTVVDDRANNFHARPSPDGTRIAFDSDRDGLRGVYVADSTGHNVRKVSGDGFAAVPTWSPDGERLAFVRAEPDKPRVWNLWTVDLSSGEMRRLTSHPYGQPWGGSWFPDGRHIAYSHEDDLIILDIDNGTRRVYHTPRPGHLLRTPAVSPDGRRIIFQVYRDGAWILELSDGSMRKVLSDPSAEEYTWSPDGRRVAFHSRQSGEWGVWLMAAR